MNRSSLRVRIIAGLVTIVLLVVAATLLFVYFRLSATLDEELVTTGVAVSTSFAATSSQMVATNNIFALNQLVDETLAANPDVRYIIVVDVNGNVLAHSFDQGVPGGLLQANASVSGQPYNLAMVDTKQGLIRDLAVPISDGKWGTVRIGLSDARMQGILAATTRNIIFVTAIILLLAIAGGYIYSGSLIIRPVSELHRVAQAVIRGDLTQQANVRSQDELGTLAFTFNSMTTQLRETLQRLEQRVAERTKALATSGEVSRRLSTILEQRRLVVEVVEQVQSAFNYYHVHIYLLDQSGEYLVMAGGTGEAGAAMLGSGHKIPKGRGLVGRAAETNAPVLAPDVSQEEGWLPNPLLPETKSEVAVPIAIGDRVLGVLDVQHNVTDGLTQEDANLLQSIANQVAIALQNIKQTEIVSKRASELQTVAAISTAAATISDVQKMLETVVHLTQRRFGLYHAHVFTFDETTQTLGIVACGWKEGDEREGTHGTAKISLAQEQSLVARAARTRQAVIVNDVHSDPGWLPNPLLPDTASEMAVPLIVGDQFLGVLDVQSDHADAFTEEDANIQTTLASQVATALQNAHSFAQVRQHAEHQTMLNAISQKIQSATTVEAVLQIAARELGHALGAPLTIAQLGVKNTGN